MREIEQRRDAIGLQRVNARANPRKPRPRLSFHEWFAFAALGLALATALGMPRSGKPTGDRSPSGW